MGQGSGTLIWQAWVRRLSDGGMMHVPGTSGRKKTMDAIFLQILNGLDKGGAYALIALGLTLVFGTLGVVNFAHGALFMLGAFCAVTLRTILNCPSRNQRDRERLPRQSAQGSGALFRTGLVLTSRPR
jgi:ABC-type branched-subunit amino acid transport system permease subunit